MNNPEIQALRARIDEQDEILFRTLRLRAGFARRIGEIKRQQSQVAHVPERERQVLEKFLERSDELLSRSAITSIYREIMSACLRLEEPLRVAALGPLANTFSSRAARRAFGSSAILVPEPTLSLVIEAVEAGRAHHAVVPMENSTEGPVHLVLQSLVKSNLKIVGHFYEKIEHQLASKAPSIADVKEVYSHPQALAQCRQWLLNHLKDAEWKECSSTGDALEKVKDNPRAAAVCHGAAAFAEAVPVLSHNIHDNPNNETRFFVISKEKLFEPRPEDITSLVLSVSNSEGKLADVLQVFSSYKLNLSKILSIPDPLHAWKAYIWLDVEAASSSSDLVEALGRIQHLTSSLRVFGSYPLLP